MPKPGTCRLYDKNFNLLATWSTDEQLYFVEDLAGQRQAGPVTEVRYESFYSFLDYVVTPDNPLLPPL
jgi:hypothetical protein